MSEARIGRVVVAALHQALGDQLPLRLEFYEHYLRPMRLREGNVGAASFLAALSFLRHEDDAWEPVMTGAGRLAADWTFASMTRVRRGWYRRLPARWRARIALRLSRDLAADTVPGSRARVVSARGGSRLQITGSAFCDVRETSETPMCGFYGAVVERFCERLDVAGCVRWQACRAMGQPACVLELVLRPEPARERAGPVDLRA
jgi:hypothetical protein